MIVNLVFLKLYSNSTLVFVVSFLTLVHFYSHFSRVRSESCSSVPSIPNPFPELCSPSKSPVLISSLPPQSSAKHVCQNGHDFIPC